MSSASDHHTCCDEFLENIWPSVIFPSSDDATSKGISLSNSADIADGTCVSNSHEVLNNESISQVPLGSPTSSECDFDTFLNKYLDAMSPTCDFSSCDGISDVTNLSNSVVNLDCKSLSTSVVNTAQVIQHDEFNYNLNLLRQKIPILNKLTQPSQEQIIEGVLAYLDLCGISNRTGLVHGISDNEIDTMVQESTQAEVSTDKRRRIQLKLDLLKQKMPMLTSVSQPTKEQILDAFLAYLDIDKSCSCKIQGENNNTRIKRKFNDV